jgi:hypothetical protein
MKITSTLGPDAVATAQPKYPYIGVWDTVVVLFTGPNTGTCLKGSGIGEVHSRWSEAAYTPLKGSITLTQ